MTTIKNYLNPPRPPKWIDRVQFITYFLMQDCSYPFWVYWETAKPAAGRAAFGLLEFGFFDLIRAFFRPKGLRSARHGRKGRRGKRRGGGLPELSEIIARRLPGYAPMRGRHVTQGVKNLWIIDNYIQHVLYHVLIINLTTDFLYDWTSAILTHPATDCSGVGRMMRTDDNPPGQGLLKWQALLIRTLHYEEGNLDSSSSDVVLPAGRWFVTVTLTAGRSSDFGSTYNLRLKNRLGAQETIATAGAQWVPADSTVDFVVSAMVEGPMTLGWDIYVDVGFSSNKNATVVVMQQP